MGGFFGTLISLVWPLMIYRNVLRKLHSKTLGIVISSILFAAACLGFLAFCLQALG